LTFIYLEDNLNTFAVNFRKHASRHAGMRRRAVAGIMWTVARGVPVPDQVLIQE